MQGSTAAIMQAANPNSLSQFGGAHRVDSLPRRITNNSKRKNPDHFESVPRAQMTLQQFQDLLDQVVLTPFR